MRAKQQGVVTQMASRKLGKHPKLHAEARIAHTLMREHVITPGVRVDLRQSTMFPLSRNAWLTISQCTTSTIFTSRFDVASFNNYTKVFSM